MMGVSGKARVRGRPLPARTSDAAWRGVKDMDSKMINSVMRGVFLKDMNLRREFLSLIPQKT